MSVTHPRHRRHDAGCRDCPRLAAYLRVVRDEHPDYHAAPVEAFGDPCARLLIVGLAPGMHGANRTGRPFTGDHAGILLYRTLHRFGFSSAVCSTARDDGLRLRDCRITNAVKCVPPQNRPEASEVRGCNRYLAAELAVLGMGSAILALGTIAHRAVLLAFALCARDHPFAHGAVHRLANGHRLFDSYHCSRYNLQTNRLDRAMFENVFASIVGYLKSA